MVNGVQLLSKVTTLAPDILRQAAYNLKGESNRVIVLGSVFEGKPNLVVALSDDLTGKYNAPQMVRAAGKHIQGGGGGQPNLAMAGGKNPDGVQDAVNEVVNML